MSDYMITLDKLSYKLGKQYLLKDITWNVAPGEHWAVFGMNGSGKTTLLSIIAGYTHFTAGSVKLFGQSLSNDTILDIRKRIGFVSSSFFDRYYTKESVQDIVLSAKFGTLGLGTDINLQDVRLAKELLGELCLGDKINQPYYNLSKGERQKVLIARALFTNPEILILDEACSGLDLYNRQYLFHTIEDFAVKTELTIIYVTHHIEEVSPLFQKMLLLKDGYVLAQGKREEIITAETMYALMGHPVNVSIDSNERYHLQIEAKSSIADMLKGR